MTDPSNPYNQGLQEFAARFEGITFEETHAAAIDLIKETPGAVLDVGAGTGRDAAWFAGKGWDVVAVEPAADMRAYGELLHRHPRIRWLDDRLPGLEMSHRLGQTFDLIWLSAVWMHVAPGDRTRAFRKIVTLLKPGGRVVMTLRHGPADLGRRLHPVSRDEIERLALHHGLTVLRVREDEDRIGRAEVSWTLIALALPDDSTGALPLVRGIVLNDSKSSTYKLALLRVIARIADSAAGLAEAASDEHVRLPLGLVALYWLRMFKPLLARNLPQSPVNAGLAGLGFVRQPFVDLMPVSPFDLRIGAMFEPPVADALRRSLADAARTIARMPATFLTFADGSPILPTTLGRTPRAGARLTINPSLLWTYGEMRVPTHLWLAMRRLSVWIEPMLIGEWVHLTKTYAARQGRTVTADDIQTALIWLEPVRETRLARERAIQMLENNRPIYCVWSGDRLSTATIDIDHCFPWSAWPCSDLWNLLPTHRDVNQRRKRDRLVSAEALHRAHEPIADWWRNAFLSNEVVQVRERFWHEAQTTLPLIDQMSNEAELDALLTAIDYQRLRLRQDQQLEEWAGTC